MAQQEVTARMEAEKAKEAVVEVVEAEEVDGEEAGVEASPLVELSIPAR